MELFFEAAWHLVGFLVVLLALTVLWGLTALIGVTLGRRKQAPAGPSSMPVPAPVVASAGTQAPGESDEDLVVVAAAVAHILTEPHRIVSIRAQSSSWGQQGRREIHASHRIR